MKTKRFNKKPLMFGDSVQRLTILNSLDSTRLFVVKSQKANRLPHKQQVNFMLNLKYTSVQDIVSRFYSEGGLV